MIQFDYRIERDEGDEKRVYLPGIPKQLDDLTIIEGPNSSGKSTLLHILALGFHGLKDKRIHPSLRKKMDDLVYSDHQTLGFDFRIDNEVTGLRLVCKKGRRKPDISLYQELDGKRTVLSPEAFRRKYNLIYDIPDNPTERLRQLTTDLKSAQHTIGSKVGLLNARIREVITDIGNSRDPRKIKEFENTIKKLQKQLKDEKEKKIRLEKDLRLFERYLYGKSLIESKDELKKAEERVRSLKKKKRVTKTTRTRQANQLSSVLADAHTSEILIRTNMTKLLIRLRRLLPKEKTRFERLEMMDLREVLIEAKPNDMLREAIEHFRAALNRITETQGSDEFKEAKLYSRLIETLCDFQELKTLIPGVKKTVAEFIEILEEKAREFETLKAKCDNIDAAHDLLNNIEDERDTYVKKYSPKLQHFSAEGKTLDIGHLEDVIDIAERELEEAEVARDRYAQKHQDCLYECKTRGISEQRCAAVIAEFEGIKSLKPYVEYTEMQLRGKITDLNNDTNKTSEKIKNLEFRISSNERDKRRLEKQEPHRHQGYADWINTLFEISQRLYQRIQSEYDAYLLALIEETLDKAALTTEQKQYYDQVSHFLGRKVEVLRHVDNEYEVDRIDLINDRVHTKTGKKIKLSDLGTGQSQSAYIKGLLNQRDDRKIIALIDEVAMMDSRSLQPIYKILHKLHREGSLLLGVVVQRADEMAVGPIMLKEAGK